MSLPPSTIVAAYIAFARVMGDHFVWTQNVDMFLLPSPCPPKVPPIKDGRVPASFQYTGCVEPANASAAGSPAALPQVRGGAERAPELNC